MVVSSRSSLISSFLVVAVVDRRLPPCRPLTLPHAVDAGRRRGRQSNTFDARFESPPHRSATPPPCGHAPRVAYNVSPIAHGAIPSAIGIRYEGHPFSAPLAVDELAERGVPAG